MNKEEIIKAIENLPHLEIDNKRPISAYDSVDMKDIQYIIDNMNDNIKTYIELVQENKQLKDNWNKLKELFDIQKESEEYDSLQWLEYQTTNYENDSIILHRYRILYNLILKSQQENKKQKDNWSRLKDFVSKTKIKEFEKAFGKRYGKTFTQAEIIVCNMILDKMQELEKGDSNE